ncbi:MAG TPA: TonB family protein [Thermoanaerobaculia bacterium]|nr:TonB family protein [Thermoanaerobaculia bacterium]
MKELVGPYRIQSLLGHGGMGIVYLGVHDHLGREVAIKALAPELTQHPQFRERFFAEARVQAKLQHTNIVTIYDLIEDAGSYFIVMEYVPGPTLEDLLKDGSTKSWEIEHTLSLFQQVLAGLDYAHSKGVIHRDVKSSNVLIADGDQVKLTDFGIALLVGDKRLTASQSTIGTPTYMSPEQILRPREVDHRSDVYSAAIVLYEMLAGQPPFDAGTEYEIKKLQIEAPIPDLRTVNPRVPESVAEAISVAMRKEPDERFPSAGAFLRALQGEIPWFVPQRTAHGGRPMAVGFSGSSPGAEALSKSPEPPPPPPGEDRESAVSEWFQGKNRWIALAAAVLILLAGFGIANVSRSSGGGEEKAPADVTEVSSPSAPQPVSLQQAPAAPAEPSVSASAPVFQRLREQTRPSAVRPIPPPTPTPKKKTVPPPENVADRVPEDFLNDGPFRVGGAVSRPELISGHSPVYTELARKARLQGTVVVEAIIDESGNVTNAQVLKGLPLGLDQAALQAVQNWKFRPATLNGQPVKVYYSLTIKFQIE